jgi:3'-phosphoadenosine 5'-phosphosulfate sulfotransferase (PAPS reductase)/FAD synthetase
MRTLHHVGLSGGKDSTALWGWILNESGIDPADVRGTFADTGNEYPETYKQIKILSAYGVSKGAPKIKTLRAKGPDGKVIGFLKLCLWKQRFPSARARFCTTELKINPSVAYVEKLKAGGKFNVIGYTGVRASESAERALLADEDYSTLYKIVIKRPLLDWSIQEVWEYHKKWNLPINPLYFQGRKRVGCRLCCMSNKRDIRVTAELRPETITMYRRWEKLVSRVRYLSRKARNLETTEEHTSSSFFPADTTPDRFHSRTYLNVKGERFTVNTIDDVVRWSYTMHGAKHFPIPFIYDMDEDDDYDKGLSCKSAMGSCE